MWDCGKRTYDNIDRSHVDTILKSLIKHGSTVSGQNPWDVETKSHGVCLRGEWNQEMSKLTITVTDADWYVTKKKIWENIESLMRHVREAA